MSEHRVELSTRMLGMHPYLLIEFKPDEGGVRLAVESGGGMDPINTFEDLRELVDELAEWFASDAGEVVA